MGQQTTVWAQLAVSEAVQYAVPYIDPNSLQPTVDPGSVAGVPTGGGFVYVPEVSGGAFSALGALSVGTAGDLTGTDAVNAGAQFDSYVPVSNQLPAVVGGVPGHSVSTSRGTRYLPAVLAGGDFIGEFAAYGYVSNAGVFSYSKLAGINALAAGASATYPGGELRFATRLDAGGALTDWFKVSNLGNFEPVVTGVGRLGSAAKGFAALTLDYTISATIGAVIINKPAGSGNIALGASSVVVTNSLVTANSLVLAWLMQTDGSLLYIKSVIPTNGSFTVTGNANAAANCKFGFLVINTDS
jgi:hypothetical protein